MISTTPTPSHDLTKQNFLCHFPPAFTSQRPHAQIDPPHQVLVWLTALFLYGVGVVTLVCFVSLLFLKHEIAMDYRSMG